MDNIAFVVDENLKVISDVKLNHNARCEAVYRREREFDGQLCSCDGVCSVVVPVYGFSSRSELRLVLAVAVRRFQTSNYSILSAAFNCNSALPCLTRCATSLLTEQLSSLSKQERRPVALERNTFEDLKLDPTKMPLNAEETALLGMDDIELKNIQLQFPSARRFSSEGGCSEQRVRTDRGDIVVAVQGDRSKPAIITYHDLGLNYVCFQPFFNFVDMRALLENFCVYHVNAPGQEDGAPSLPEDYVYPTMDELANQLNYVLGHFGIKTFIGFGVGAGANILARFALTHPSKVDALALINCTSNQAGWIEWAYQKMNSRSLKARGMTQGVLDYLMWHHFGRFPEERNHDLTQMYRAYFTRNVNPTNLSLFIDSYVRRTDLGIARETDTIKVPVLNITGALSPHVDDTVTFNGRLNPNNSTWMKISDSGMVLEEQPAKISEAFRLFLQGEGYVAPLSPTKIVLYRRLSDAARRRPCRHSPVIRITENPISEAVVC